jgi:hypothetical protein
MIKNFILTLLRKCILFFALFIFLLKTQAQSIDSNLLKMAQNKIANLLTVPFQNNMDFGIGPNKRMRNTLNIQPVIPVKLSAGVNLITRTIVPIVSQPLVNDEKLSYFGLGDINPTFFISPAKHGKLIWGFGPSFLLPTATLPELGTQKWSVGPGLVLLIQPGHLTLGAYTTNVFSFAGNKTRKEVNLLAFNPYMSYQLPAKFYLTSSPIISVNWNASKGNKTLVPLGLGVGKISVVGKQPMNFSIHYYVYVVKHKQTSGPESQLRLQWVLLFPKTHTHP